MASFPPEWLILNRANGYTNRFAEQGKVAEELEAFTYTFTGPNSRVFRQCRTKSSMQNRLFKKGLIVPYGLRIISSKGISWKRFPAIVKPDNQHSSIGITRKYIVFNHNALRTQVEYVLDFFRAPVLIEEFIDGREFTVTVWGNRAPTTLPPIEIDFDGCDDPRDRILTFSRKFGDDDRERHYLSPARLEIDGLVMIRSECIKAYKAIGCRVRVFNHSV